MKFSGTTGLLLRSAADPGKIAVVRRRRYAAPRVDAAQRTEYLRSWERRLHATAADPQWQARLRALADTAAANRAPVEDKACAAAR